MACDHSFKEHLEVWLDHHEDTVHRQVVLTCGKCRLVVRQGQDDDDPGTFHGVKHVTV
jgi:hypothetical protein